VTNIQRGCVYDGPGVRTTIFLKGCLLCCPWCSNPETFSKEGAFYVDNSKCLKLQGISSSICNVCERSGGDRSVRVCPFGVAESVSYDYSIETLFEAIMKDKVLYNDTCGGVTFSGGEPLLQADALIELIEIIKKEKIHVTFETSLVVPTEKLESVLALSDCFIIDYKLQPQMKLYDESYFSLINKHLQKLVGKEKYNRLVFVDEMLECKNDVLYRLQKLSVSTIEILLCHDLGVKKYERLGMHHKSYKADKNKAEQFVSFLNSNNIITSLLTI
jgi:pyruvate formate lyase activating enzyme